MARMKKILAVVMALAFVFGVAGMAFSSGPAKDGDLKLKGGEVTAVDKAASTITVTNDGKEYVFEVASKYLDKAEVGKKVKYVEYSDEGGKLVASKVKWAGKRKAVEGC